MPPAARSAGAEEGQDYDEQRSDCTESPMNKRRILLLFAFLLSLGTATHLAAAAVSLTADPRTLDLTRYAGILEMLLKWLS